MKTEKVACFTMDVDWAPDFVIKACVDWFLTQRIPVTLFCTHVSEYCMLELAGEKKVEIGIHPDFSRNDDAFKCIANLLDIYPNAEVSRSHKNIDGRVVTDALVENGIKYHSNKILFGATHLTPTKTYNGMLELPYFWEDGYHLELGLDLSLSTIDFESNGFKIFNIHPVLFYLNLIDDEIRKEATYFINDLTKVEKKYLDKFVRKERGIADFTKDIALYLRDKGFVFKNMGEILNEF